MTDNVIKLLEEKVGKMISFIQKLKKEKEDIFAKLAAKDIEIEQLKNSLAEVSQTDVAAVSKKDIVELVENLKEERTAIRDGLRGALRLITE